MTTKAKRPQKCAGHDRWAAVLRCPRCSAKLRRNIDRAIDERMAMHRLRSLYASVEAENAELRRGQR